MAEYLIGQRYRGSGVIMPGLAGETIPRGAIVYMSAADGLWYLADSDALGTLPAVGVVSDAGTVGNVIQILVVGIIERSDWTWTRGDPLYVSGTAGVMTQTAPAANAQVVAVAITATLIYVNPQAVSLVPADNARIATGTYTGDGTISQAITGIGFQPIFVWIWRNAGAGELWVKTDTMAANAHRVDVSNFSGNRIISLDADGFTVDDAAGNSDPNTDGIVYAYLALA